MFTGIIEETGTIEKITGGRVQTIAVRSKIENQVGDSICIQGICLTVTGLTKQGFTVEVMKQTERVTTLPDWRGGDAVNLERALRLDGRLGGHILLGHVDEIIRCIRIKGNEYFFQAHISNKPYLVPKGSVALDGVSLTIGTASGNVFSVNLIPYTREHTTLGRVELRSAVNVEYDYLAKIVHHARANE
jgi:riboflavin synthase